MFRALSRMGTRGLAAAESALRTEQRARGVTFRVGDGAPDRLFPLDLVPRIVTADDWAGLSAGLTQRVRALEAFLRDVYGPRQIIADGVIPAAVIDDAPGWSRLGTASRPPTPCASRWRASTSCATGPTTGSCWRTTCGCPRASGTPSRPGGSSAA